MSEDNLMKESPLHVMQSMTGSYRLVAPKLRRNKVSGCALALARFGIECRAIKWRKSGILTQEAVRPVAMDEGKHR